MHRKIKLFLVFSALLLTTMCRFYDQGERITTAIDGMSCQAYTDYFEDGLSVSNGLECYYTCPSEVVGPIDFEADPSLSSSKGDLDRQLCGIAPQFAPTNPPASASPTPTAPLTPTALITPIASSTALATATAGISPTAGPPLLTGQVTKCDMGLNLINFRIAEPVPDLTGKALTVLISELESICEVNPTNTSILSCTVPTTVTFPISVVVSLDGAVVNDFTYDGAGCIVIATVVPTTTP